MDEVGKSAPDEVDTSAPQCYTTLLSTMGAGKSAIWLRVFGHGFVHEYDPTIEDAGRQLRVVDGKKYNLNLLDTAGQPEYRQLRDAWIRSSQAFAIVIPVHFTAAEMEQVVREEVDVINRVHDIEQGTAPWLLCASKCDLDRVVTREEVGCAGRQYTSSMRHSVLKSHPPLYSGR